MSEVNLIKAQTALAKTQATSTEEAMRERTALRPQMFAGLGLNIAGQPLAEIEKLERMSPLEKSESELIKIKFNNLFVAMEGKYQSPQLQGDIDKMTGIIMGLKGMSYEQAQEQLKNHITELKDEANALQLSEGTGSYLSQTNRIRAGRDIKRESIENYLNRRKEESGAYSSLMSGYTEALVPYQNYRQLQQQAKWATAQNRAANRAGMMSLVGTAVGIGAGALII